jgi:hypothetical protein
MNYNAVLLSTHGKRIMNTKWVWKMLALIAVISISACSPKFDWREVRNEEANFVVLLPSKPASYARDIHLDELKVNMKMQAAQVDEISFAVGFVNVDANMDSAKLLAAMKNGMLNNIQGAQISNGSEANKSWITANGKLANGGNVKMIAQFVAKGQWVYQVVILGNEKQLTPEVVDMFMSSFKIDSK